MQTVNLVIDSRPWIIADDMFVSNLTPKRLFDIVVSATALVLLSPLLLMVIWLISLEEVSFYVY